MILCEFGPGGMPAVFRDAREVFAVSEPGDVGPALQRLEAARKGGSWVAGWIGYEAGYALEPALAAQAHPDCGLPLLVMGLYDQPETPPDPGLGGAVRLAPFRPLIGREDYARAFGRVQGYLAAGDCYQVNLTFPLESRLEAGSPRDLYLALKARQEVGFGAYIDEGGAPIVASRSPELFFRLDRAGHLVARPMKGTAPRDADPVRDADLAAGLGASEKNRAENLMIVDLLRNDIARICRVGSVKVPELFKVDTFATVHQMSSTVTGQLAGPPDLADLMRALFPCGSITGAPKIRAMEIIREVEPHPRGVYCGAIGWMGPDGAAAFSVAIRTAVVWPDGRVRVNVGGGIVQDSTLAEEWEEALWKARFIQDLAG